jgi:hypothetical protein
MTPTNGNPIHATVLESLRKLAGGTGNRSFEFAAVWKDVEDACRPGRPVWSPSDDQDALRTAVLTCWNDLLRSGVIDFGNPGALSKHWDSDHFYLTETGRKTLEHLGRDPINRDGYMRHLQQCTTLDPVSGSYIKEALHTYQAGCYKATAVMVGTAAEGMILHLREVIVGRLRAAGRKVPKDLDGWKIKAVCDTLGALLESNQKHMPADLAGAFDTYWAGFTSHIRAIRNSSGHPNSIEPVSAESVHAALLLFPEFAKLVGDLEKWAAAHPF